MAKTVQINFHGVLQELGNTWNLAVNSVGEAVHAINRIKKGRLNKFLQDNDKRGIKYRVLINGRDFMCEESPSLEKPETIYNSELTFRFPEEKLKTIDFVPVLEGGDQDIFAVVLGVVLIVVGIVLIAFGNPAGFALVIGGLGLVAAGVINLLSSPPKFDDFREFDSNKRKASYLFNGPENITREGGPVPVIYGRLLVGSQVISASFDISDRQIDEQGKLTI